METLHQCRYCTNSMVNCEFHNYFYAMNRTLSIWDYKYIYLGDCTQYSYCIVLYAEE